MELRDRITHMDVGTLKNREPLFHKPQYPGSHRKYLPQTTFSFFADKTSVVFGMTGCPIPRIEMIRPSQSRILFASADSYFLNLPFH